MIRNQENAVVDLANSLKTTISSLWMEPRITLVDELSRREALIKQMKGGIEKDNLFSEWKLLQTVREDIYFLYYGDMQGNIEAFPFYKSNENNSLESTPWFKNAINNEGQIVWSDPYLEEEENIVVISTSKTVEDPDTKEILGVFAIEITLETLKSLFKKTQLPKGGAFFLTEKTGKPILSTSEQFPSGLLDYLREMQTAGAFYVPDRGLFVVRTEMPYTEWNLIITVPKQSLLTSLSPIKYTAFYLAGGFIMASFYIFVLVYVRFRRKALRLSEYFTEIGNGSSEVRTVVNDNEVLRTINGDFNQTLLKLRRSEEEKRASEAKYTALVRNAPIGIFQLYPGNRFVCCNDSAARIFGFTSTGEMEANIQPFETFFPQEAITSFYHQIENKQEIKSFITPIKTHDGKPMWVEINAEAQRNKEGGLELLNGFMKDITAKKHMEEQLYLLANTDELTGVYNRRYFFEIIRQCWELAIRYGHPLSFLMLDIDHFKRINDLYGHGNGDTVLKNICGLVSESIRTVDFFARLGGEEFGILLPETEIEGAVNMAERIRTTIEQQAVFSFEDNRVSITVCIGVASLNTDIRDIDTLLKSADNALYRAKRSGRNRIDY
jgi:diguanylate cyclase (GGDEF)-like protein/PAS domain S-box-containing protein